MKESRIISDCKKGKQAAHKALYELYMPYVVGICRRFNIPDQDLKDIVQEVFIEVFLNIKKFNEHKGSFKYWLKSIAIHKILNKRRKQKGALIIELEAHENDLMEDNHFLSKVNKEYLMHLIAKLPDGYRTVFNLYAIDGYTHKEIGEMLGISEVGSRSQLSRAKKILKDQISRMKNSNYESI